MITFEYQIVRQDSKMFTSTYLKSHYSQLMAQHSDLTPLMFSTPLSSAPHLDYGMMGLTSISKPPVTPPVTASESTPSSSRRSLFGLAHSPLKEIEKEATSSSLMESVIETATNSPRKQRNVSTESKASSSRNLETAEVNLNAIPIPKHEIECDIETFLVDRIKNFFSKTGTNSDQKMEVQKEVNIFEGIPSFAVALRADRLKQIEQTNEKAKISVKYNELPYHSLMKRTFLGADDRTPKEEDRRKKNSQAALKSRAKNKIYAQKLEEEAFEAMKENFELKRKVAFLRAQVNSTLRKHGKKEVNFNELFENKVDQVLKIQPKQSELNCTESE
ncbi:CLUMA_CG007076, isoform A [Clunio marinus]|uniref:CLUMA_CG007076, isoform A n=1 Tax=Clunio marinus TaxID=568069 RepID=A0A1J1HZK6_9DIPT|nr:CLUMA_CG007076, isoform A [Clunio marinus]